MANANLTSSVIARDTLDELKNAMVLANLVQMAPDDRVTQAGYGGTIQLRRPVMFAPHTAADVSVNIRDVEEGGPTLAMDQRRVVAIQFTSEELTHDIEYFRDRYSKQAACDLAQSVDSYIAGLYTNMYNRAGDLSEPSLTLDIGEGSEVLSNAGVPFENRWAAISPGAALQVSDTTKNFFNKSRARTAMEESFCGRMHKIDVHECQSLARHTTGAFTTGTTPLVNGASQEVTYATAKNSWTQSLITDGWGGSGTVKAGDQFTIADVYSVNQRTRTSTGDLQVFTITADGADVVADLTVTMTPPMIVSGAFQTVDATAANNAAITFVGTESTQYPQHIFAHKSAIQLAFSTLEAPIGNPYYAQERLDGISLRVVGDYNVLTDTNTWRFDIQFGAVVANPMMATRRWG